MGLTAFWYYVLQTTAQIFASKKKKKMKRILFKNLIPLDVFSFAPYSFEPLFVFLGVSPDKTEVRLQGLETKDIYSLPYDDTKRVFFYENRTKK